MAFTLVPVLRVTFFTDWSPAMYGFLADLLVAVHVGYVAYVLVGEVLILVGWAFGRQWVRNFWFRATHLLAIDVVVFEEVIGVRCPLTVWEEWLRVRARSAGDGRDLRRAVAPRAALLRGHPAVGVHRDPHDRRCGRPGHVVPLPAASVRHEDGIA